MSNGNKSSAEKILEGIGGAGNIKFLTCCATRLRFELNDNSIVDKAALDAISEVMGCVPQSGERYQIVVGGGVATMHSALQQLLEQSKASGSADNTETKAAASNDDVKASLRSSGVRGKVAWVDGFFEYLSDSFRPILGILLGASLIIALCAVLDALHIVDFRGDKSAGWVFVDSMWHSVFYFLPIMVAYNASKKLKVDPWLGAAIMGALMTPDFQKLTSLASTSSIKDATLGTVSHVAHVFGLPMQLNDYSGNVFVPLIMVAVLALVYRFLKKIIPENLHMVFVPFLSLIIMIPLTAFLIGPLGVWIGTYLGLGLALVKYARTVCVRDSNPVIVPIPCSIGSTLAAKRTNVNEHSNVRL